MLAYLAFFACTTMPCLKMLQYASIWLLATDSLRIACYDEMLSHAGFLKHVLYLFLSSHFSLHILIFTFITLFHHLHNYAYYFDSYWFTHWYLMLMPDSHCHDDKGSRCTVTKLRHKYFHKAWNKDSHKDSLAHAFTATNLYKCLHGIFRLAFLLAWLMALPGQSRWHGMSDWQSLAYALLSKCLSSTDISLSSFSLSK